MNLKVKLIQPLAARFARGGWASALLIPNIAGTAVLVLYGLYQSLLVIRDRYSPVRVTAIILLLFFSAGHFANWVYSAHGLSAVELKTIVIIFILGVMGIVRLGPKVSTGEDLIFFALTLFTVVGLTSSLIKSGTVFRFPDHMHFKTGLISIYYGCAAVVSMGLSQSKRIKFASFIYVIFSGSGTALLGAFILLGYQLRNVRFRLKLLLLMASLALIPLIFISQESRGRDFTDLSTVDRFVIQSAYVSWAADNFSQYNILVGCGIYCDMKEYPYYMPEGHFRDYIIAESNNLPSGRNLHNDHLRIFNHFGLMGWMFAFFGLFVLLRNSRGVFFAVLGMSCLNTVITATPVLVTLLVLGRGRSEYIPATRFSGTV